MSLLRKGALVLGGLLIFLPAAPGAQSKKGADHGVTRLRIEVTAGKKDEPVENASVYIRYKEERFLRKAKKVEIDLKTNHDGIAKMSDLPQGKILVQVIAQGWKTFGEYFTLDQAEQTIHIKLEKPPHWY